MSIIYLAGTPLKPQGGSDHKAILHICGNAGTWDGALAAAIAAHYPNIPEVYQRMVQLDGRLGRTYLIPAVGQPSTWVALLVARQDLGVAVVGRVRYWAIESALNQLADFLHPDTTLHIMRPEPDEGVEWRRLEDLLFKCVSTPRRFTVYAYWPEQQKEVSCDSPRTNQATH